jgi:hypothetical protein
MRRFMLIALTLASSLFVATTAAEAVVVDMNAVGQASVAYSASTLGDYAGVALVPGTCASLSNTSPCSGLSALNIPTVSSSAPCTDPSLTSDLWLFGQTGRLPDNGACYHGGAVMHQNETFALTWDSQRAYWSGTRGYVEQFLRDVADGSGGLTSPYAVTSQYTDNAGRAANSSKFGGGCIDYGNVGRSACEFGSPTGAGHDFPANGCTPTGGSFVSGTATTQNTVCLTDAQLQGELSTMIAQTGIVGRTAPGHTPLVVLLMPPGVETCLDAAAKLCSANSSPTPPPPTLTSNSVGTVAPGTYNVEVTYVTANGESVPSASSSVTLSGAGSSVTIPSPPAANGATGWYAYVTQPGGTNYVRQNSSPNTIGTPFTLSVPPASSPARSLNPYFCSYHSQVNVGGTEVSYVVQPWNAVTACDEPDAPAIPQNVTPQQLAVDFGLRLVSPLSQAHIAAVVNPGLNGWFALDGAEINDNHGCASLASGLDSVTVGSSSQNPYLLQREFNNAGVLESDPNTYFGCAPDVLLAPTFVVPSAVNQGDEVQFDASPTASTLIVPNSGYVWDFGDGTTAVGPSVVHSYAKGGTYAVKVTVTDRGGDVRNLSQTIQVLGSDGLPVSTPTSTPSGGTGGGTTPGGGSTPPPRPVLRVHLQLLPQSLPAVLRAGIAVRVSSNEAANGIAQVSISRSLAKRAKIKVGRGPSVVIGTGTVSAIKGGTVQLHLVLSRATSTKLKRLKHVTLTIRLSLIGVAGDRLAIDAAGRY